MKFENLFQHPQPIIGMVHLMALPESPSYGGDIDAIYERALAEAQDLAAAGVDGLIVENFGDEPLQIGEPTAAQLALMAGVTREIRRAVNMPIGVNVQFNAWQAEVAIAHTCGAQFIRVEVFVDTVISAQGMVQPCSAQITRYRKALGASGVALFTDIQTKYTANLIPQSIQQSAIDAHNAGADALIVTGAATGAATPLDVVAEVKGVTSLPVIVGSGTNIGNVTQVLQVADGAIVGSSLKEGGKALNRVSRSAAEEFMRAARGR